jgi:uncharacterized phage infection (PIP) family protein YhgE
MAKAPSKRRGITLGYGAGNVPALDLSTVQPTAPVSLAPDQTKPGAADVGDGSDTAATLKTMAEDLAKLRRTNADLERHWKHQAKRLQQLERQREEIELETRRLDALGQRRRASGRLGILLALLAITGVAALGFHTWPRLQEVTDEVSRVSSNLDQITPQLESVNGKLSSLTSNMGQMGSAVASLRDDVSGVRTNLGALRGTVDPVPANRGAAQANVSGARGAAPTLPRNMTTMRGPYPAMRPMMPW